MEKSTFKSAIKPSKKVLNEDLISIMEMKGSWIVNKHYPNQKIGIKGIIDNSRNKNQNKTPIKNVPFSRTMTNFSSIPKSTSCKILKRVEHTQESASDIKSSPQQAKSYFPFTRNKSKRKDAQNKANLNNFLPKPPHEGLIPLKELDKKNILQNPYSDSEKIIKRLEELEKEENQLGKQSQHMENSPLQNTITPFFDRYLNYNKDESKKKGEVKKSFMNLEGNCDCEVVQYSVNSNKAEKIKKNGKSLKSRRHLNNTSWGIQEELKQKKREALKQGKQNYDGILKGNPPINLKEIKKKWADIKLSKTCTEKLFPDMEITKDNLKKFCSEFKTKLGDKAEKEKKERKRKPSSKGSGGNGLLDTYAHLFRKSHSPESQTLSLKPSSEQIPSLQALLTSQTPSTLITHNNTAINTQHTSYQTPTLHYHTHTAPISANNTIDYNHTCNHFSSSPSPHPNQPHSPNANHTQYNNQFIHSLHSNNNTFYNKLNLNPASSSSHSNLQILHDQGNPMIVASANRAHYPNVNCQDGNDPSNLIVTNGNCNCFTSENGISMFNKYAPSSAMQKGKMSGRNRKSGEVIGNYFATTQRKLKGLVVLGQGTNKDDIEDERNFVYSSNNSTSTTKKCNDPLDVKLKLSQKLLKKENLLDLEDEIANVSKEMDEKNPLEIIPLIAEQKKSQTTQNFYPQSKISEQNLRTGWNEMIMRSNFPNIKLAKSGNNANSIKKLIQGKLLSPITERKKEKAEPEAELLDNMLMNMRTIECVAKKGVLHEKDFGKRKTLEAQNRGKHSGYAHKPLLPSGNSKFSRNKGQLKDQIKGFKSLPYSNLKSKTNGEAQKLQTHIPSHSSVSVKSANPSDKGAGNPISAQIVRNKEHNEVDADPMQLEICIKKKGKLVFNHSLSNKPLPFHSALAHRQFNHFHEFNLTQSPSLAPSASASGVASAQSEGQQVQFLHNYGNANLNQIISHPSTGDNKKISSNKSQKKTNQQCVNYDEISPLLSKVTPKKTHPTKENKLYEKNYLTGW